MAFSYNVANTNATVAAFKNLILPMASVILSDMTQSGWMTNVQWELPCQRKVTGEQESFSFISEEVLSDAHTSTSKFVDLFKGTDLTFVSRPKKSLERVNEKFSGGLARYDAGKGGADFFFKVISDFSAVRVSVKASNVYEAVEKIQQVIRDNGGVYRVRNHITEVDESGKPKVGAAMKDIILYMFAFVPSTGYVVEMQIGSPFASKTFEIDSVIRGMRSRKESIENVIDLWNDDTYSKISAEILKGPLGNPDFVKQTLEALYSKKNQAVPTDVLGSALFEFQ
ncbi:MAG: hypothetical protein Terrestrivirus1_172 [Terrestrivirus sp.]|uniref:Uncharacterized protein n=1 Tax=Terrestrivirus sp. TaxID=2487775 RepID=A0A3G4ZKD4_9VIRU|nr:MAG: hypothetical protein Terrestrivirus1_172 [Terrestrivirus sp.]